MISHRDIAEIHPLEDGAPKNMKLALKVHPFPHGFPDVLAERAGCLSRSK
jgi:hypothetical protein